MDRKNSRKNIQNINIDKVTNKIGLPERIKYDSIDVFIDKNDNNNLWAIVNYSIEQRKKRVSKEEIIKFNNYNEMLLFLQNNFDTYELNHQVNYLNRSIFFHNVDYIDMCYYLYEGKPDLNYIEINYKEYINDGFHIRKRRIPKEYDRMLFNIIKSNKKYDSMGKIEREFYKEINVNEKKEAFIDEDGITRRISRQERRIDKEKKQIPMEEPKKSHKVRNIVIYASVIAILTTGGIVLSKNTKYKKEIITQKNLGVTLLDYYISHDKDKALSIVNDLMINNYQNISVEDLNFLFEYIKNVTASNYDSNKSSTFFNYKEYFDPIIWKNENISVPTRAKGSEVMERIEQKYSDCFKVVNNKLMLKEESVKSYIDYVASLTFMYDTIVDKRNSGQIQIDTTYIGKYAPKEDIEAYNQFPMVLKYIILNQLQDMIYHSNYKVSVRPSNYFGGIDKYDLVNEVRSRIENIKDLMKTDSRLFGKKTI